MDVNAVGADPVALAAYSSAQSAQELGLAVSVSVLGKSQQSQEAVLSLIMSALGVGQNLDVFG